LVLLVRNAYPVNLLHALRRTPEIVNLFCASANPVQVIVGVSEQGRGVMGVIDGKPPKGVEGPDDVKKRHELLRRIGYKR
jgi:adenosine/AMP kinase